MTAELTFAPIPELETENFEYALFGGVAFFKMKTESNWHELRPATMVSQIKQLHNEVQHLKNLLKLQLA